MFLKKKSDEVRKALIVGDSHCDAVRRALKDRGKNIENGVEFIVGRYRRQKNNTMIGNFTDDDLRKIVKSFGSKDLIVSCTGGNQHSVLGMVQHPQAFDVLTEECDAVNGSRIIPYKVIYDIIDSGLRGNDFERIAFLKSLSSAKVAHLMPPPAKEDSVHILRNQETLFRQQNIAEAGVTNARTRLNLWKIQFNVLRDICDELEVMLVEPPEGTCTSAGYLEPAYYADDATHANKEYGEKIIQQVSQLILKSEL